MDPGIDVLKGNSVGLMHNKFVVVDRDDVNNSWVLGGSTNWTTNNLLFDFNNIVMVQDQAIAKAYTIEFEEMWGSSGPNSNFLLAKFGSTKTDNTPHNFRVGGRDMDVYFSPSDQPTNAIVNFMATTDASLEFAILSFTKNEIGAAVASAHNAVGAGVRGVMESISDQGEEFTWLTGTVGVDLLSHQGVTYSIHHKYAVVDANLSTSDPTVLTGSHNWSTSAETKNDENTMIIHDEEIANHFHQEFNNRHCELNVACTVGIDELEAVHDLSIYPNPNNGTYSIGFTLVEASEVSVRVHDMLGRIVHTETFTGMPGQNTLLSSSDLGSGAYIVELSINEKGSFQPLIIK